MMTMRESSSIALVATAAPGVPHQALEGALIQSVDSILVNGIPPVTLLRAQQKALTDHYSVVQRLNRRADFLAFTTGYLDAPYRLKDEGERYCEISIKGLMEFGQAFRQPENRVILLIVPQGEKL